MLPSNAFSTVTVHGLVLKDGAPNPQTFQRGTSRPGEEWLVDTIGYTQSDSIPTRPPSSLPPPGNHHLSIMLGDSLVGSGRVGTVHYATLLSHETDLPPLVIKVSRYRRSESLETEAYFYEELETIQGIAVPRCYGFFQIRLENGTEVSTWNNHKPRSKDKLEGDPTLLSILLLERLGGKIPMRQTDYTGIEADVYEIFNDIGRLGIEHLDLRWSNILSVDQNSKHASFAAVCPNHGHAHEWRIVDFDLSRKTNGNADFLYLCHEGYLRRVFDNAPWGCVVEPWE